MSRKKRRRKKTKEVNLDKLNTKDRQLALEKQVVADLEARMNYNRFHDVPKGEYAPRSNHTLNAGCSMNGNQNIIITE